MWDRIAATYAWKLQAIGVEGIILGIPPRAHGEDARRSLLPKTPIYPVAEKIASPRKTQILDDVVNLLAVTSLEQEKLLDLLS